MPLKLRVAELPPEQKPRSHTISFKDLMEPEPEANDGGGLKF